MSKRVVVNPESDLAPRPGDEFLTGEELAGLELFADFKRPPNFDKFPGSLVLREFHAGDVICRQGDGGSTAFYILKSEDVLRLKQSQLETARQQFERAHEIRRKPLQERIERLKSVVARFTRRVDDVSRDGRRVATAHLFVGGQPPARRKGLWRSANRRLFGGANDDAGRPPSIPNDGPADIDFETKQAPMFEGEVFGEMSCMTLAPRSATIVADGDCYMLEFLRNIFDQMQKDAAYRARMDAVYRERVLKGHLRRIDVFRDLTELELDFIGERVELRMVDPGDVICDEHDPSDGAYIIRSGLVQVVADLDATLTPADITDWQGFCAALAAEDD